jgi:hypothetical protein
MFRALAFTVTVPIGVGAAGAAGTGAEGSATGGGGDAVWHAATTIVIAARFARQKDLIR